MLCANDNVLEGELSDEVYALTKLHTLFLQGNRLARVDRRIAGLARLGSTFDYESPRVHQDGVSHSMRMGQHGRLFLHRQRAPGLRAPPEDPVCAEDVDGQSKGCYVSVCEWFASRVKKPKSAAKKS